MKRRWDVPAPSRPGGGEEDRLSEAVEQLAKQRWNSTGALDWDALQPTGKPAEKERTHARKHIEEIAHLLTPSPSQDSLGLDLAEAEAERDEAHSSAEHWHGRAVRAEKALEELAAEFEQGGDDRL